MPLIPTLLTLWVVFSFAVALGLGVLFKKGKIGIPVTDQEAEDNQIIWNA